MNAPWTRGEKAWLALVALLLLVPLFQHRDGGWGLPQVHEGDPPHYLIMVNSLIEDGDLDLGNNYDEQARGGVQAGRVFANADFPLEHHTTFWVGSRPVRWNRVYEPDGVKWERDAKGFHIPTRLPQATDDVTGLPETPMHPAGMPLIVAPFAWPFRGTRYVEPAMILLGFLATFFAMLLFHGIARTFAPVNVAVATTALAFLGTPVWHYARSFFSEPFLLLFFIGGYYFPLRRGWWFVGGVFLALGILVKPPFALVAAPLLLWALSKREWRSLVLYAVPCGLAAATLLVLNWKLNGSPLRPPQPFVWGNPLITVPHLLFGRRHGIVTFAPVLLVAFFGWWQARKQARSEAEIYLAGSAVFFAFIASWALWNGGWCYGPRFLVPILPFLMLGLTRVPQWTPWLRRTTWALGAASIAINFIATYWFYQSYRTFPFQALFPH